MTSKFLFPVLTANKIGALTIASSSDISIAFGSWTKLDEHIGAVELPPDVDPADFIGAEKETRCDLYFVQ